jgi:hypothetical protein
MRLRTVHSLSPAFSEKNKRNYRDHKGGSVKLKQVVALMSGQEFSTPRSSLQFDQLDRADPNQSSGGSIRPSEAQKFALVEEPITDRLIGTRMTEH